MNLASRWSGAGLAVWLWMIWIGLAGAGDAGALKIEDAWARASIGAGKAGAVYLNIHNHGSEDDRLIAAAADTVAGRAELHDHIKEGDVMKMRHVAVIPVPAAGNVILAPGGLHVMLFSLKAPLQEGAQFPLSLTFAKSGEVTIEVTVKSATAGRHGHKQHHGHKKDHGHKKKHEHKSD